jgi:DNA-directed RNA polymerase subunit RPC12/RpoP
MKCRDCGQDILQTDPEMCPYCRSKNLIREEGLAEHAAKAGALAKNKRFEEAALLFEKLDLWDKAKACRLQARKAGSRPVDLATAKVESVALICPHCGFSQTVASGDEETVCAKCGTTFLVPESVAQLEFEKAP